MNGITFGGSRMKGSAPDIRETDRLLRMFDYLENCHFCNLKALELLRLLEY